MQPRALIRAGVLLALGISPAYAQDAPAKTDEGEELSEVIVTGYRASLAGALEIKRNSDLVVDAISGGDIGALPDVTIAETLVRLPGINGTRDRGNQSQAAVRGLGPRLVLGLVNGREVASSEPNRNVRWEIYPSEVVAGVDVYKAQSADIVAGGVAGTIDIKTIRPLDYSGPDLLLRGGAVYYEAGADFPDYDPYGYRGSGSFTRSVGDNFAFNLGVSLQRQKNAFPSFQGWGYNDSTMRSNELTVDITNDGVPDPVPWGAQTEVKKLTEDRLGVNGSIGWRVNDNFEINIDALFSKFTIDEDQNQAWYGRNFMGNWDGFQSGCYTGPGASITQASNGTVVSANLDNCWVPVTNVIAKYTEDKDLFVTGANAKYEAGAWTTTVDLSHSEATRTNRWAAFFTEIWPQNLFYDMSPGRKPVITTSGASGTPADPASQVAPTWLPGASDGPDNLEDRLSALRLDFARKFEGEHFKELSFGLRGTERAKEFFRRDQDYALAQDVPMPASYFTNFSVNGFTAPALLNGDYQTIADFVYGGAPVNPDAILQSSIWNVDETVTEAFFKLRFAGSLGSVPFNAHAGVRVVQTETTSQGFISVNGSTSGLEAIDADNDYTEALPSVNFNFNLAEDKLLRVGLARVLARPPLDELRASRSLWNEAQPFTGQAGNPMLDPFVANQADVSFEWYFAPEALAALAVFYKDVDTHIGYNTEPVEIEGDTYLVTAPRNGDGGGIAGAELTFQTPFPFFRNMGLYFNYAYVDTEVKEFVPLTNPLALEGYAKDTAALDLWFNMAGFEARLGYKYHSPFTIIGGWDGSDVRTLGEERVLDLSTSYQVNDAFGVRLQVNNLNDRPVRIWRDNDPNRLGSYNIYGRRALLDFTFKF
jgi:iron complex outermembrane receptor protein